MTYDASNPDHVKDAKRRAYHLNEREHNAFVKMCNDPDLRYLLNTFIEHANVFHSTFNQNPSEHAFNEGFRNGGLWWLNKALLHDRDILSKIQSDKDATQREENNDHRNERSTSE